MSVLRAALPLAVETIRRRGPYGELPPGPLAPPAWQLYRFLFEPIEWLKESRDQFGEVMTLRLLGVPPIVQFHQPAAVKEIFTASSEDLYAGEANAVLKPFLGEYSVLLLDGKRHLSQRRLLLPPFRGERMRAYGETIRDVTLQSMKRWPRGTTFEMQKMTQAITLDVILETVFGVRGREQEELRALLVQATRTVDNPLMIVGYFQKDLGPRSPWGRYMRVSGQIDERLTALIRARRDGKRGDDILSLLVDAKHEDGTPMRDEEIRDELATLLVAGHETTATGLSWAVHRLTRHPHVLRRLQQELREVYGDGPVDPETLSSLKLLEAFCKETLRVHPVVPGIGRRIQRDMRIGGYDLPQGIVTGVSILLAHSNPKTWGDPEQFRPERFIDTRVSPYQFLPFGGGIRRCIGEAFALYEMRVVLATMLQKVEPEAAPGVTVRTARRNITLSPSGNLPIRMRDV